MLWFGLGIFFVCMSLLCMPKTSKYRIWIGSLYLAIQRGRDAWTVKDKSLNECTVFFGIHQCAHSVHTEQKLYQLIAGPYIFSTAWMSKGA